MLQRVKESSPVHLDDIMMLKSFKRLFQGAVGPTATGCHAMCAPPPGLDDELVQAMQKSKHQFEMERQSDDEAVARAISISLRERPAARPSVEPVVHEAEAVVVSDEEPIINLKRSKRPWTSCDSMDI